MTGPEPTEQDRENARLREEIAARQAHEYGQALKLALTALGPGDWHPWMKLVLLDADHRRTGDTTAVATVYKVCRGPERLSENSVFVREMSDGTVQTADSYEPLFGSLLEEKHPTRTIEVRGEQVPVGRYELCWQALELYRPRSAEALATLRQSREQKREQREDAAWAKDNPLLVYMGLTRQKWEEEQSRGR